MQLDQLTLILRPRSSWEAMELGIALVRRHAWAIWKPWLLLTVPVLIVLNLLGWWLDRFGLAALCLWWLKPVFERIPLYVISRAAFGTVPSTKQTLLAQWSWGWRPLWAYLLWRRWGSSRSLFMPVDFLEGGASRQRRDRRSKLGGMARLQASGLTWVMLHFEWMLQIAGISLVFAFIPLERLSHSLQTFWTLFDAMPTWLWLALNFLAWAAMTIIGPFYSGAGFGLYLNRRTQLEAWDIEIAFRRLRDRLAQAVPVVLLALLTLPLALPLAAQSPHKQEKYGASPIALTPSQQAKTHIDLDLDQSDNQRFSQAVEHAYEDPKLGSTRTVTQTRWRVRDDPPDLPAVNEPKNRSRFDGFDGLIALLGEMLLWLLVLALVLVLLLTYRRWWPWLQSVRGKHQPQKLSAIEQSQLLLPEKLPPDILASAQRLWQQKQPRQALALLYRAGLDVLAQRAQLNLPVGATEAHCLRLAQQMPVISDRELFVRLVGLWQNTAWAKSVPSDEEFTHLLAALGRGYGWRK